MNTLDGCQNSQVEEQAEEQLPKQVEAYETPEASVQAEDTPDKSAPESPTTDDQTVSPDANEAVVTIEANGEPVAPEQGADVGEVQTDTARGIGHVIEATDERGDQGETVEQRVNIDTVQANTVNLIAQANIRTDGKATDIDRLPLVELRPDIWRKVKAVFVPSQDYQDIRDRGVRTHEDRVFIVYGEEHAGKFTCAVHLGLDLLGEGQISQPKFSIYKRTPRDIRLLVDFAQEPNLTEDTIYIIEDAFESGVDLIELSSPYLSAINTTLEGKKAYLILTTTYQTEQLAAIPVSRVSAVVEDKDMHAVFEKHLTRYGSYVELVSVPVELIELARKNQEELVGHFQWPFQVDLFCYALSRLSPEEGIQKLLEVAGSAGRIGEDSPYLWFERLPHNAKLYTMLVVLFEGIDRYTLDEIYGVAVRILRDKGVSNLDDPREMGLNEILERIQAQETNAHLVRFNSSAFERQVRHQIVNHHHLLWSFIELPLALIETFSAPHFWEFRRDLGAAIGRLGIYHIHKLYPMLEALARHPSGGVVAVAGYALDEICRAGPEYYTFVTDLLEDWVSSGDPALMWAAGASIWRIYDGLARVAQVKESQEAQQAAETLNQVRDILTTLAETCDRFNSKARAEALEKALVKAQVESTLPEQQFIESDVALLMQRQLETWAANNVRSILHAVRWIARMNSRGIIELIATWLKAEEGSNLRKLGQMAGRQLFDENSDPEIQLLEERHGPLLYLVGPLLSTDEDTVDTVTRALLVWLQRPGWAGRIHSALLHVVNRAEKKEEAGLLRESVSRQWLDSDSMDAQRIGRSLIARSYVIEGVPMEMPGHLYGVIALDASREARMNKVCARAGRRLYERFDPQVDMYVVHMGETQALATSGQSISTIDLQADHDMPRILMPSLEELDPSRAYFALALAWGPIIDIDDACAGPWSDRLIVAVAKDQDEWPEELRTVPVDRLMSKHGLNAIEDTVRERLAQALAALSPEEWWLMLHEYVQVKPPDIEAIVDKLNSWVDQLDNVEYSQHPGDIARIITCFILWLAASNLPRCVEVIRTWLTNEDELSRLIGAACGKTLFRIYAQCDPAPPIQSHAILLELAPLLAKQGWSEVEAVLYAARRWAVQPEWSDRLATRPDGSLSELMQLVDAVTPESRNALADALTDWLATEDDETAPETVVKLAERLQLHMALGAREPLPDLPEGYTYGLIVVDASSRDNRSRNRLAKLASSVIKRLSERNQETLRLLVYRLGQDYPVAGPGQKPDAEVLVPPSLGCRPRLLGPLLEIHSMEQVGFVLLLTNGPILDQDDWSDTLWSERISVYSEVDDGYPQPFALIRKQFDEEAESAILRHLKKKGV